MGSRLFNLVVFILPLLSTHVKSDGLANFIELKMSSFPNWIAANNLDPSPNLAGPTALSGSQGSVKVEGELSNHGLRGHSTNVFDLQNIDAAIGSRYFSVSYFLNGNVTFAGRYNMTVSKSGAPSNNSHGDWYIHSVGRTLYMYHFNYNVTPSGYINVQDAFIRSVVFGNLYPEMHFENMWQSREINMAIRSAFEIMTFNEIPYPFHQIQHQYLKEIFEETPVEDIIGTPRPPQITI